MLAAVGLAIAFSFRAAPLGGVSVRRASVHATATSDVVAPPPTTKCKPYDPAVEWKPDGAVDEAAMLAKWSETYPIAPDELVNRAKWVIAEPRIGLVDDSCLSPDFEFCAPFIGPLNKDKFIEALSNFQLQEAFPDINDQYHAFRADPFQPGRVWWNTRTRASHTGAATKMMGEPTGKELEFPPQSFSLIFDKEGLVRRVAAPRTAAPHTRSPLRRHRRPTAPLSSRR